MRKQLAWLRNAGGARQAIKHHLRGSPLTLRKLCVVMLKCRGPDCPPHQNQQSWKGHSQYGCFEAPPTSAPLLGAQGQLWPYEPSMELEAKSALYILKRRTCPSNQRHTTVFLNGLHFPWRTEHTATVGRVSSLLRAEDEIKPDFPLLELPTPQIPRGESVGIGSY